jgi:adenine-specific DNA-methyltransferase
MFSRALGQFKTPGPIADSMVEWATYRYETPSLLDPGVGTGVFVQALLDGRRKRQITGKVSIDCIDIDQRIMALAKRTIAPAAAEDIRFIKHDFLRFDTARRYSSIVCNPPYLKHHRINGKAHAGPSVAALTGYALPVTTNSCCLFLFRARALLAHPGRCAFIIPSEFLNADYGVQVKRHLAADPAFRGIIAFDFHTLVFEDALTTACIVLFEHARGETREATVFTPIKDPTALRQTFSALDRGGHHGGPIAAPPGGGRIILRRQLEPAKKWKNYFSQARPHPGQGTFVPLAAYAACSRGIATGANHFFTMSEARRRELGIPLEDVLPCVTRAADVPGYILAGAGFRRLSRTGARIYLLNPRLPLLDEARSYIAAGKQRGIAHRYLPAHRDRWFLPERQTPAELWVTVFSRGRTRFIWNRAGVNHLTTFHGIYPTPDGMRFLAPLLIYLWSDACQRIMEEHQRQYGNGLKKYEPRDIESIRIPDFRSGRGAWLDEATEIVGRIRQAHAARRPHVFPQEEIEGYLARTWLGPSGNDR